MELADQNDSHPELQKALLCCPGNEDQVKRSFQVYMDLCEAKTWHDVELHHCMALNLMFVSARRGQGQPRDVFLPIDVDSEMSHENIQSYFSCIKLGDKETTSITLAVCDSDTSTVYYKLSSSLIPPDPPNVSDEKKRLRHMRLQNKRQHLAAQTELFRMEKEKSLDTLVPIADEED